MLPSCWQGLEDRSCLKEVGQWEMMEQKPLIWPVSLQRKDSVWDERAFHTHRTSRRKDFQKEGWINWSRDTCFWRIQGGKRRWRPVRWTPTWKQRLVHQAGGGGLWSDLLRTLVIPKHGKTPGVSRMPGIGARSLDSQHRVLCISSSSTWLRMGLWRTKV